MVASLAITRSAIASLTTLIKVDIMTATPSLEEMQDRLDRLGFYVFPIGGVIRTDDDGAPLSDVGADVWLVTTDSNSVFADMARSIPDAESEEAAWLHAWRLVEGLDPAQRPDAHQSRTLK
ncbi:hypothetical protein D1006_41055 [Burkholderia stabilis]|uniref:Uncharacterized protein n=1 Tax=Burkholderia stabilis TaxID=95485 RepID=A0A4Q2A4V3_9BURK|nr:hypothetical protein [Burkholderia stabilis]RXV64183.1 hypothetical protein D1006_41055 [Burkholderia stabilis]